MLFNILALISTLIIITLLRRLVNIFPTLIACAVRWKENLNLEDSVKNSFDRDIIALAMVVPFCLIVNRFGLYAPKFMSDMDEALGIGTVVGIFFAYSLIRVLASMMIKSGRINKKTYNSAAKAAYTFFIILALLLVATGGVLSFIKIDTSVIRDAMLWISAFIYTLFLLRKFQIFVSGFSILTSFLYLCALEIIPTGLLIGSALIF